MKRQAAKGFTLIELAIVIVIVGILAAVAIPKFANTTASAEKAVAKDFLSQLNSAYSIKIAESGSTPAGFDSFVDSATSPGSGKTLAVGGLGKGGCTVAAATISCPATTFPNLNQAVVYTFNTGSFTVTCGGSAC